MTENKQFCKWLLFVTLIIFGVSKGIPAVIALMPTPLPELAFETETAINRVWAARTQDRLLRSLERDVRALERTSLKIAAEP